MDIAWANVTPWSALAGGLLIGLAAGGLLLFNGRIAGVSGILGGLLHPARGETGWRLAFLAGMAAAPLLYALAAPLPQVEVDAGWLALAASGLLVGISTRHGGGCTSGHGGCGMARRSPRSLATIAFMGAGCAVVYLLRQVFGSLA
ncbi:YeeE/YedE family protein [Massilia sp. HP4]|uniref:YeeE/YedE family protein n=1 Tax=Massilia sp. HP4 TaxID=2562316 RepID=UPI0010C070FF|nr:YeeE/YedE family protein [Massilia sp. HP4]